MPTEIEIRARIKDAPSIIERLLSFGFLNLGSVEQKDIMLDLPDASLFRSGRKLRLRTENGKAELTYKGVFQGDTDASRRTEVTLPLSADQVGPMLEIMESLGYPRCFCIPKRRMTFEKGGLHVVFDEWPIIGTVMEIEGSEMAARELASVAAPGIVFGNGRLKDFFKDVERETGKTLAELQEEHESETGQGLGRLDLLVS